MLRYLVMWLLPLLICHTSPHSFSTSCMCKIANLQFPLLKHLLAPFLFSFETNNLVENDLHVTSCTTIPWIMGSCIAYDTISFPMFLPLLPFSWSFLSQFSCLFWFLSWKHVFFYENLIGIPRFLWSCTCKELIK